MFTGTDGRILWRGDLPPSAYRAFLDKIFPDDPVEESHVPEFFYPCDLVPAGEERSVVDLTQEAGNCRSIGFSQLKMGTDVFDGEPLL